MAIGLIIIGDEILSGRRHDRHLSNLQSLLSARGLQMNWVQILADDMVLLVNTFKRTLASNDIVFCTGGIGATPDDLTRAAVAKAQGVELALHPQGQELLEHFAKTNKFEITDEHRQLVTFPLGAGIYTEPKTGVPGFSVKQHFFMPGFPELAQPMMKWILDNHYYDLHNADYIEKALMVYDVTEGRLTSVMDQLIQSYPQLKLFILPMKKEGRLLVELGLKGEAKWVDEGMAVLCGYLLNNQLTFSEL